MTKKLEAERARGPYQCLDALSPEDFAALQADILERGVLMPIEFDEDGNVLDGHHRLRICEKHGITNYPTIVRRGLTEAQKRTHARRMNLCRRHLSPDQRRKLIEQELRENREGSNRRIAAVLGVDHKTVGAVRAGLESGGKIPQVDQRTGADGKCYALPLQRVRCSARSGGEIPHLDPDGNPIPTPLVPIFQAVAEFVSLDNALTTVKQRMLDLARICPPLKEREQVIRRYVGKLQEILGVARPERVHCGCGGAGCEDCEKRGYETLGDKGNGRATADSD